MKNANEVRQELSKVFENLKSGYSTTSDFMSWLGGQPICIQGKPIILCIAKPGNI